MLMHSFSQELPKKGASVGYSNDSSNASAAHKPMGV
jgi:hypothetical protein